MAVVPYGCISGSCEILKKMIAACPSFQVWVAAVDEDLPEDDPGRSAGCLPYIHYPIYEEPDSGGYVYPAAVIEVPEEVGFDPIAQGAAGGVFDTGQGVLTVAIYWKPGDDLRNDMAAAWLEFSGVEEDGERRGIGALVEDLTALGEEVEKFEQFSVTVVEGPLFLEPKVKAKAGVVLACALRVRWGLGG